MKKRYEALEGLNCVMIFDPNVSQDETDREWVQWYAATKSAVQGKAVPNVHQTRKMLHET